MERKEKQQGPAREKSSQALPAACLPVLGLSQASSFLYRDKGAPAPRQALQQERLRQQHGTHAWPLPSAGEESDAQENILNGVIGIMKDAHRVPCREQWWWQEVPQGGDISVESYKVKAGSPLQSQEAHEGKAQLLQFHEAPLGGPMTPGDENERHAFPPPHGGASGLWTGTHSHWAATCLRKRQSKPPNWLRPQMPRWPQEPGFCESTLRHQAPAGPVLSVWARCRLHALAAHLAGSQDSTAQAPSAGSCSFLGPGFPLLCRGEWGLFSFPSQSIFLTAHLPPHTVRKADSFEILTEASAEAFLCSTRRAGPEFQPRC